MYTVAQLNAYQVFNGLKPILERATREKIRVSEEKPFRFDGFIFTVWCKYLPSSVNHELVMFCKKNDLLCSVSRSNTGVEVRVIYPHRPDGNMCADDVVAVLRNKLTGIELHCQRKDVLELINEFLDSLDSDIQFEFNGVVMNDLKDYEIIY